MGRVLRRAALRPVVIFACACESGGVASVSSSSSDSDTTSTTTSSTSESSSASAATTSSADTSSSSSSEVADTSTSGAVDDCPGVDPEVSVGSALVLTMESNWPIGFTTGAPCDVLSVAYFDEEPIGLRLACIHPDSQEVVELVLRIGGIVEAHLESFVGMNDTRLAFFNPEPSGFGCSVCLDLTLRDSEGGLLVLSKVVGLDGVLAEGRDFDLTGPAWLEPMDAAYASWSAPFETITAKNLGCNERENLRPGSETETPLAIEFASASDSLLLYDRNAATDVAVGEETLDVIVSRAFFRGALNCANCPVTELAFLIARAEP